MQSLRSSLVPCRRAQRRERQGQQRPTFENSQNFGAHLLLKPSAAVAAALRLLRLRLPRLQPLPLLPPLLLLLLLLPLPLPLLPLPPRRLPLRPLVAAADFQALVAEPCRRCWTRTQAQRRLVLRSRGLPARWGLRPMCGTGGPAGIRDSPMIAAA